nr:Uma2 family endonuclease [Bradyrhizobium sp. 48]
MGHAQRTVDERPQDASEDLTICGGGDFLAEQGVADRDEFRVKSHLCHEIASIVESRKLTQAAAAEITGQKQSDLSRIITHRHNDYSVWRLMKMLSALGADILVTVNPSGAFEKGIIYSKNVNDHASIEPESPPFSLENYELDRVPGETDEEYADRLALFEGIGPTAGVTSSEHDEDEQEKLSIEEFFRAISGGEARCELVGGIAYVMARATEGHNVICSNVMTAFVSAAKAKGYRTTSRDTAVRTGPDTVRYPDVLVDCGPPNAEAMMASRPTLIVEVSSPGTAVFDYGTRLREYQGVESVNTVMQIESEIALVKVHRRQEDGAWTVNTSETFDVPIWLPTLGMSITLNVIYDTLGVTPRPRLGGARSDRSSSECRFF